MKYSLVIFSLLIGFIVSSCKQNLIEATTPKAAKNVKEAKARLVGVKKWNVDELIFNGVIAYSNGQNLTDDVDVVLLYMVFQENGNLEIVYKDEPTEILKYKLDEANNVLTIYEEAGNESYFQDWKIEAGSVYKDSFTMTFTDDEGPNDINTFSIKMKELK
jgi:hypothetical protein